MDEFENMPPKAATDSKPDNKTWTMIISPDTLDPRGEISGNSTPYSWTSSKQSTYLRKQAMSMDSGDRNIHSLFKSDDKAFRLGNLPREDSSVMSICSAPEQQFHDPISEKYYGTSVEVGVSTQPYFMPTDKNLKKANDKSRLQSKRLPPWAWFLLIKILGMKKSERDRAILGWSLRMLTILSGLIYTVTYIWYQIDYLIGENVQNHNKDILNTTLLISIGIFWCSLGIFSNYLAHELFHNVHLVDSIRLHTKTVAKINTALLLTILAILQVCLNMRNTQVDMNDMFCNRTELNNHVCITMYVSKGVFSVFAAVWNTLVGIILLSACRTHTIGIRRFIHQLLEDSKQYETQFSKNHTKSRVNTYNLSNDHSLWSESLGGNLMEDDYYKSYRADSFIKSYRSDFGVDKSHNKTIRTTTFDSEQYNPGNVVLKFRSNSNIAQTDDKKNDEAKYDDHEDFTYSKFKNNFDDDGGKNDDFEISHDMKTSPLDDHILNDMDPGAFNEEYKMMTNDEILLSFWKISCRLRATSAAFQQWLVSWALLSILWSVNYIFYWLNHPATLSGIAEFIIPVLMLPLIGSAYGQVNYEGGRVLRCLMPTEDRIQILYYMTHIHLVMNAYGFAVNYNSIKNIIAALLIGVFTPIIIDMVRTN